MSGTVRYHPMQNILSSSLVPKNIKIKKNRTITLPFVSYGCETRSLTMWGEERPRVFENRVIMKIQGSYRKS